MPRWLWFALGALCGAVGAVAGLLVLSGWISGAED